ncbi:hypothetical protein PFICI_10900 [Pestalotiopsis fici W106-1]|uniref:Uncharacterized protein n=1 Tax=Pestalotiopsis fici (strain W106-1 / CGMCC3.15140) TaxID=1229662 RepID=W3WVZ5_PESFW|nr:uncharacterized protein PFICI_10900 [Pestalotiopsis fici W106-1]ETS77026.1 hypothetical protein PFICI_10900 [Pestalotiopsis fici W106-1]
MLSNSIEIVKYLSRDLELPDDEASNGVWFDVLSQVFVAFGLNELFAVSVTLLAATPLILLLIAFILQRSDKYYFFSFKKTICEEAVLEPVLLDSTRGIFRFPVAVIIATGVVVVSVMILNTYNPFAIYANAYTVWATTISLFYLVFWAVMTISNDVRPSALHRGYVIFWLFTILWIALTIITALEHQFHLAMGYPFILLEAVVSIAAIISLLELCALPTKTKFAQSVHDDHETRDFHANLSSNGPPENDEENHSDEEDHLEVNETSPLFQGNSNRHSRFPSTTFGTVYRQSIASIRKMAPRPIAPEVTALPFGDEQIWSAKLPSSLWFVQFLLIGPLFLVVITNHALALVASISQSNVGENHLLPAYLMLAAFSALFILPLTPFIHRGQRLLPLIMLVTCTMTITFNLITFPFDESNKYKMHFSQEVDLKTEKSVIHFIGVEEHVRYALTRLPSAMGQEIVCIPQKPGSHGLDICSFDGSDMMPDLGEKRVNSWVSFSSSRDGKDIRLTIDGEETRKCGMDFSNPITYFQVDGSDEAVEKDYLDNITLYRRSWDTPWNVQVKLATDEEVEVRVWCEWGEFRRLPILEEAVHYLPEWVTLTSFGNNLLYGSRTYTV